ncbi:branched-chain amino acid transaminase [Lentzea sp. NPDC003310]|uniref:branched-chain amino acid transaminase n=1 Tax=Lentzea sp. NPDC003310 TaxID=3154447 RepID=UPI0033A639F4
MTSTPELGPVAYHRGEFTDARAAQLPLTTQGLHYGTGVFEGIRAHLLDSGDLAVFRLGDHLDRLLAGARLLRVDTGATRDQLTDVVVELLRRNGFAADVYLRPLAYKLGLLPGTRPGVGLTGVSDALSIVVSKLGDYQPPQGIRCLISSWRRPARSAVPVRAKITGGYVNNALALDEARCSGYDDAILLDDRGLVAEATTANVFAVRDGVLVTPPATGDRLPGITRDTVLTLAADLGIDRVESELDSADLLQADELFLTGTGCGVSPVVEIAGRPVGTGRPGPVGAALRETYDQTIRGRRPDTRGWLTTVALAEALR